MSRRQNLGREMVMENRERVMENHFVKFMVTLIIHILLYSSGGAEDIATYMKIEYKYAVFP